MSNPPSNYDTNFLPVFFDGFCHVEEATPLIAYPNNFLVRDTSVGSGPGAWGNEGKARVYCHLASPITRRTAMLLGSHKFELSFPLGWILPGSGTLNVMMGLVTNDFDPATLTWAAALGLGDWGYGGIAQFVAAFGPASTYAYFITPTAFLSATQQAIAGTAYGLRIDVGINWMPAFPWAFWRADPGFSVGSGNYKNLVVGR